MVRITNSMLQLIRKNFRIVIYESVRDQKRKIHNILDGLGTFKNGTSKSIDEMTEEELKQYRQLQTDETNLREFLRISIVLCDRCGTIDGDRYYNKTFRSWFCPKCVDEIRSGHLKMMEKRKAGTYSCPDDDGEFGQSFM